MKGQQLLMPHALVSMLLSRALQSMGRLLLQQLASLQAMARLNQHLASLPALGGLLRHLASLLAMVHQLLHMASLLTLVPCSLL